MGAVGAAPKRPAARPDRRTAPPASRAESAPSEAPRPLHRRAAGRARSRRRRLPECGRRGAAERLPPSVLPSLPPSLLPSLPGRGSGALPSTVCWPNASQPRGAASPGGILRLPLRARLCPPRGQGAAAASFLPPGMRARRGLARTSPSHTYLPAKQNGQRRPFPLFICLSFAPGIKTKHRPAEAGASF